MEPYKVSLVDSMDGWRSLAEKWNGLLEKSHADTIFLTWEWLFSWAETFLDAENKLFILLVFRDKKLVGIAPWRIHNSKKGIFLLKQIEFLGAPEAGSDYLDVIAKKGREKDVAMALYEFLLNEANSRWDCLRLTDISPDSLFLLHMLELINEDGKYFEITPGSYCPAVSLPDTKEEYYAKITSNRREQFKRHQKLLAGHGAVNHQSVNGENAIDLLDTFFSFYEDKSDYASKELRQFFTSFFSKSQACNWVQIDFLRVDGCLVAALLHLTYHRKQSMYLMAVDKSFAPNISIGNVIVGTCIGNAIDEKMTAYDFLKGAEKYKFHWSNCGTMSLTLFLAAKKLNVFFMVLAEFMKKSAKLLLR